MPRSHRGPSRPGPHSLILPFALTLTTAALASAGLYFFSSESSPPSSYPGSDSEHEPSRRSYSSGHHRRRRRHDRVHDHITEEDTDAIEDSRREEQLYRKRKSAAGVMSYMKDAVENFTHHGDDDGLAFEEDEEVVHRPRPARDGPPQQPPRPSVIDTATGRRPTAPSSSAPISAVAPNSSARDISAASASTAIAQTQYVPPPRRKRPVVLVVEERKATHGHDSDAEFEELLPAVRSSSPFLPHRPWCCGTNACAVFQRSLLSKLPHPLELSNTILYILIHSPHMASETQTIPAPMNRKVRSTDNLTVLQPPEPMPSPSLQGIRFHEDMNKSTSEIACEILPAGTSQENIVPFSSMDSLAPLLRKLAPDVVYFEEAAVDVEGRVVDEVLGGGYINRAVVVVGGSGGADDITGLVDSDDDESVDNRRGEGMWWGAGAPIRIRHGKRVDVVEAWAVEDDWRRRIEEVDAAPQ